MIETINQILDFLIANYALYMVVTMSVIISLTVVLLALIKKPIKALTSKIPNEKVRKLANKMFIFFAFGLSASAWLGLKIISPAYFSFEPIEVLLTGAFSIVLYALGDGIITSASAQNIVDEIINDTEDTTAEKPTEKSDNDKNSAVNEFLKKVK